MPTLIDGRIEFYHLPKTGGNWVRNAVRRAGLTTLNWGAPHDAPRGDSPRFGFCIVRNPLDWYRSFWSYRQEDGWRPGEEEIDGCRDDSLDGFVENVANRYPGWLSRKYRSFAVHCDFVGRTERLARDLCAVLESRGCVFAEARLCSTPVLNAAGALPKYAKLTLSSGSVALIAEHEADAFARHGYRCPGGGSRRRR